MAVKDEDRKCMNCKFMQMLVLKRSSLFGNCRRYPTPLRKSGKELFEPACGEWQEGKEHKIDDTPEKVVEKPPLRQNTDILESI